MNPESDLHYILQLLDDRDEVVEEALCRELGRRSEADISILHEMAASETDPQRRAELRRRLLHFNTILKLQALERYGRGGEVSPPLFEGCFLAASLLDMDISRDFFTEQFFRCLMEYQEESSAQRTAVEEMQIFNHIFFHRLRFAICDKNLTNERTALPGNVLMGRKGNQFAITLLYFTMAEEAGLPVYPLFIPGGIVPVYIEHRREQFYVNLHEQGALFTKPELLRNLRERSGGEVPKMEIIPVRAMLNIYFESMAVLYDNIGERYKGGLVQRALEALGGRRYFNSEAT